MELVIVTLAVLVAAAEITAIVRVAEKETSLKNFQLLSVSLFPLIHITIEKRRCKKAHCFTEDNVSVNISAINDAVTKGDSKFKFTDCYNMAINGRISDDYIITNKESAYLLDTIYVCYDELFVMLNDSLSKRDISLAILLHLKIRYKVVSEILHISCSTVRSIKSRMKNRMTQYKECLLFSSSIDHGHE